MFEKQDRAYNLFITTMKRSSKRPNCDIESLRIGFIRYKNEHGYFPNVLEMDACPYLPFARQIQRKYKGGIKEVREKLGIEITDFRAGTQRSELAIHIGKRGLRLEKELQIILIEKFGEMYVHEQKPFDDYKGRLDFVVYSKNCKFGIDIFYAKDKFSFRGCLNIKLNLYTNVDFPIYLLQANDELFDTFDLHAFMIAKKNKLPPNLIIVTNSQFADFLSTQSPFHVQATTHFAVPMTRV
jgi:hypothetical protein